MELKNKKVAMYCRVGTLDQTDIKKQEETTKKLAQQHGETNWETYFDKGYSANNTDRPALKKLLDDIEKGKIEKVYMKDISRLTRNTKDFLYYTKDYFPKHNVKVIIADGFNEEKANPTWKEAGILQKRERVKAMKEFIKANPKGKIHSER